MNIDIERETILNLDYRRVIQTGPHMQVVLMSLDRGEFVPLEEHDDADQFVRIESGNGTATVGDKQVPLREGISLLIPAGTPHEIVNTSPIGARLKFYTIYSKPLHGEQEVEARMP